MGHSIYITFNGRCEEAINYYEKHLGGKVIKMQRYGEAPVTASETWKDKVMHAVMDLQGLTIMFSDGTEGHEGNIGTNISIALDFDSEEQLEKAYNEMSDGGMVTMALQDTFWGARFGMCTDKFGMNWMFNYDKPEEK